MAPIRAVTQCFGEIQIKPHLESERRTRESTRWTGSATDCYGLERFLVEKLHFCYDNVVHLISCAFSFRYASTSDVFSLDLSGRKLNNIPSQNRMLCQFFRPSAPGKFHVALLIDYDGQMVEHPRDEFQSVLLLSHQLTM